MDVSRDVQVGPIVKRRYSGTTLRLLELHRHILLRPSQQWEHFPPFDRLGCVWLEDVATGASGQERLRRYECWRLNLEISVFGF